MIYKVNRKLTLTEREQIRKIKDNKTDSGIILTDLIKIDKYNGMLIIPHKFEEQQPYISVVVLEDSTEVKFNVLENIIGDYELIVKDDIINLRID